MSSGRAAKTKDDQAFTRRTVAAMVSEMVEDKARSARLYVQFEALAASVGVKVDWENTSV